MHILETDDEQKFCKFARNNGCMSLKLEIPSQVGFPDQLVLCPHKNAFFIEFKIPNDDARKNQKFMHKILKRLGFNVYVCKNLNSAKEVLLSEISN